MANNKSLLEFFLPLLLLCSSGVLCDVTFHFTNQCQDSLFRGSNPSIGDLDPELGPDVYEIFNMDDHYSGSIWFRTKCTTNESYYFSCETGDCGTGIKDCADVEPAHPVTLLNFVVNKPIVSYEVSLIHGQNILVIIEPKGGTLVDGSGPCPKVECNRDFRNICLPTLYSHNFNGAYVGCNSACDVFKDPKYCCDGHICPLDDFTQKVKDQCPTARVSPSDQNPTLYQCKGAESYDITLCPAIGDV